MNRITMAIGALALSATSAMSATYDPTFVESSGNRPFSEGDITGVRDIGTIDAGESVGIAGRIVRAVDTWSFTTVTDWMISFVDLAIDDQQFFDSSNIEVPEGDFASNDDTTTAIFSIFQEGIAEAVYSATITATKGGVGTEDLLSYNGGAGVFTLVIDGQPRSPGATYDIGVSTVPLPAAGWLLFAGVGGLAAMKRRKKAA